MSSLEISINGLEPFYKPFFHEVIHVFLRSRGKPRFFVHKYACLVDNKGNCLVVYPGENIKKWMASHMHTYPAIQKGARQVFLREAAFQALSLPILASFIDALPISPQLAFRWSLDSDGS